MDRKRKVALTLFQSLITRSKKRRISEREDFEEMFRTSQSNRREIEDEDSLAVAISCAAVAIVSSRKSAAPRRPVINRQQQKESWTEGYRNWSVAHFKARVRVNRDIFEYILEEIRPDIIKTPTNFEPHPIEPHRQLGLTLYRLAHACDFQVIEDVFGISKSLGVATFNKVIRVMIIR